MTSQHVEKGNEKGCRKDGCREDSSLMLLLVISIQTQENEGKKKSGMGGRQPADPPQTTLNNNAHVSIRVKKKKRGAKLKAVEVQHRSTGNTKNASSSAHATLLLKKSGSAFLTYR